MSAHESMEHAEHAEHASGSNKKIALLIAVLALFLAISETLGKGAQTESISKNVEAANLWAFFQAKSIRRTVVLTAAEQGKLTLAATTDDAAEGGGAEADRRLDQDRGSATAPSPRPAKAPSSSPRTPSTPSTSATRRPRNIITSSWPPPPSRSASCWPRPPSSPACSRSPMSPAS